MLGVEDGPILVFSDDFSSFVVRFYTHFFIYVCDFHFSLKPKFLRWPSPVKPSGGLQKWSLIMERKEPSYKSQSTNCEQWRNGCKQLCIRGISKEPRFLHSLLTDGGEVIHTHTHTHTLAACYPHEDSGKWDLARSVLKLPCLVPNVPDFQGFFNKLCIFHVCRSCQSWGMKPCLLK
jgi:hypothetical protein